MTTRREFEKQLWGFLYGHVWASEQDQLFNDHYRDASPAEQARMDAAIEQVSFALAKKAGM